MKHLGFLSFLVCCLFPCVLYAQTDSISETSCSVCDSLYKRYGPDNSNSVQFGQPEREPMFPGGEKAMMVFLMNNIHFPPECAKMGIQGRVIVQFIVTEEGKIICEIVRRSLHSDLDEEVLRAVRLMPDWQPASNNGVPVEMCYTLPVLFRLHNDPIKVKGVIQKIKNLWSKMF